MSRAAIALGHWVSTKYLGSTKYLTQVNLVILTKKCYIVTRYVFSSQNGAQRHIQPLYVNFGG